MSIQAKLPSFNQPQIRNLPDIPRVGEVPGQAITFVGEQFGNTPDLTALPIINALKKKLLEQIKALVDGQLPQPVRAPKYAAHAQDLAGFVGELMTEINNLVGGLTAELEAQISFINEKINELNQSKQQILMIPESSRTQAQRSAIDRFDFYIAEAEAQISRLQSSLAEAATQGGLTAAEQEILDDAQTSVPPTDATGDLHFVHTQIAASTVWTINHNLGKRPSVMVVDSGDNEVVGDVHYVDANNLTISFTTAFGGKAFLN